MTNKTDQLLTLLKHDYVAVLGANLVGIYLHGSYVLGSYNDQVSDLDYVVVIKHPLTIADKRNLMTRTLADLWPLAPAKGLEFHVLLVADTQHFSQPLPFDFHFSTAHYAEYQEDPTTYLKTMHGVDPDLAAHLTILTAAGQVLIGPAIKQVFAPVPPADYWASLVFDIANAPTMILQQPMYTILTLCRVWAYQQAGLILSKADGGKWALAYLSAPNQALVRQALAAYQRSESSSAAYDDSQLTAFATMMLSRLGIEPLDN